MPFSVIEGTFHVVGYSPDGDSVRFQARDDADWRKLNGPPVALNARKHAQLRFEAVDTLETHYLNSHQPLGPATGPLEFLLADLGIADVGWNAERTEVTSATDGTRGYVLSRATEQNRRPVAFVYAGDPPAQDGAEVFLDADTLRESVNYRSLERGLAYPTYYKGLFPELREAMTGAVVRARDGGLGVWAEDVTSAGFRVEGLESLVEEHVILPKLFRRLAEYLQAGGAVAGFDVFLQRRAEGVIVIPDVHATHFDTVVEVEGEVVKMTVRPEDLIFEG